MTKSTFLIFSFIFIAISALCQTKGKIPIFNFDFEIVEKRNPANWRFFGDSNYKTALDSTYVRSGKYSASIEFIEGTPNFKAWSYTIPDNYAGKKITLSGYIKTENVKEGYAGLWMRIDPSIAFNNMNENGVTGTTDWTRYEITLDMNPGKTKQIVIGGLLVGVGKMWIDELTVSIDGKDIKETKPIEKIPFPADLDQEYNKGSQITNIILNENTLENLKVLGLIWGFLKYYHPNIAKGEFNWDFELFRFLPIFLRVENQNSRDDSLVKWIKNLGLFPEGKKIKIKSSVIKLEPDLDWINNSSFSTELKNVLNKVKYSKKNREPYYIGLEPGISNPIFKNENAYSSIKYPDAGFRLLTLYRYWNIIQYFFPYKNLIEEDWKNVLLEFIPKIINTNDATEYMLVVLELIGRVHDTHANIWGPNKVLDTYFGLNNAPLECVFIDNKLVVKYIYDAESGMKSHLEIGDVITTINNKSINEIVKENLIYTPASNYSTQLRNISRNILRTNDSIINIEFVRNDKNEIEKLNTFPLKEINILRMNNKTDTCFKLINKDIAYINNGTLKKDYLPEIWKNIESTKGLIIDIRNYPSDFPIYDMCNYLLPTTKPFAKITTGSIEIPGYFFFKKDITVGKKNQNYYKGKVVILINELTQSSAEFHTMAYRLHPNAIVLGSTTAGADGNVSQFSLPGRINTMISGIGIYYPDGKETQRIGIIPDIEMKPTIEGIKKGRDELVDKAIELINGQ